METRAGPENGGMRAGVPKASALLTGTIGFTAVLFLGIATGEASTGLLGKAAAVGAAIGAVAYLMGFLAVAALKEGNARAASGEAPVASAGVAPGANVRSGAGVGLGGGVGPTSSVASGGASGGGVTSGAGPPGPPGAGGRPASA